MASEFGVRQFETGAWRDVDTLKHDYEGFLSPLAIKEFGKYMTKHRVQPDGNLRNSDNWQLGIPKDAYMKSLLRHVLDLWNYHRGWPADESVDDALGGIFFNTQGYWHELIKERLAIGKNGT